jgi:hypothetical protein
MHERSDAVAPRFVAHGCLKEVMYDTLDQGNQNIIESELLKLSTAVLCYRVILRRDDAWLNLTANRSPK